jgi:hypothetical protein
MPISTEAGEALWNDIVKLIDTHQYMWKEKDFENAIN